jgi:hypothetical protein
MGDGGNGEIKKEDPVQSLEMRIVMEVGQPLKVHFPLLADKMATYGFLKIAEKTLDNFYQRQESKIIPAKGNMLDWARRKN